MELVASVSRSSGLEKDGDTLKDKKVQEDYRKFIQGKLEDVLLKYHRRLTETETERRHRVEAQENVLILFRKLREGLSSTGRRDLFALEVYETSLFLAIIFDSPRHASAMVSHLVPEMYLSCPLPHHNITFAIIVSLIHHLLVTYPTQGLFQQHLDSIPHHLFAKYSEARKWLITLAACLRNRHYTSFERETRRSTTLRVLGQEDKDPDSVHLGLLAIFVGIDGLRAKARESAWSVMRVAYRELVCHAEYTNTRNWLERSLCLQSAVSEACNVSLDHWLRQQNAVGSIRAKEGAEGRWIVCKTRP